MVEAAYSLTRGGSGSTEIRDRGIRVARTDMYRVGAQPVPHVGVSSSNRWLQIVVVARRLTKPRRHDFRPHILLHPHAASGPVGRAPLPHSTVTPLYSPSAPPPCARRTRDQRTRSSGCSVGAPS
eukprot:608361-Rhodomonas_salina.1